MTDTGTAYTATGAAGTASDLGKIGGDYIWGMAVYDGVIYVANGAKISRLNTLPSTADVNRTIEVTDIATGNVGVIYGMSAEGEAEVDSCSTVQTFVFRSLPSTVTTTTTTPTTTAVPAQTGSPASTTTTTAPPSVPKSSPKELSGSLPVAGSSQDILFVTSLVLLVSGLVMARRRRDAAADLTK